MTLAADHPYEAARKHLSRRVPAFRPLIKQVGPCTLEPHPDAFAVLARSIISQQISTKAAYAISGRVTALCGRKGLRTLNIARLTDEQLRGCGLSGGKLLSLRSLSEHFLTDRKLRGDLSTLSDDEIHEHLIPIRGIGTWTVHMFLIFSLGRLDVLPTGDLGLRAGVQRLFELEETPPPKKVLELAEPWRPYRTIGTWYLWRSKGEVILTTE